MCMSFNNDINDIWQKTNSEIEKNRAEANAEYWKEIIEQRNPTPDLKAERELQFQLREMDRKLRLDKTQSYCKHELERYEYEQTIKTELFKAEQQQKKETTINDSKPEYKVINDGEYTRIEIPGMAGISPYDVWPALLDKASSKE